MTCAFGLPIGSECVAIARCFRCGVACLFLLLAESRVAAQDSDPRPFISRKGIYACSFLDQKTLLVSTELEISAWDIQDKKITCRYRLPSERGTGIVPFPGNKTFAVINDDQILVYRANQKEWYKESRFPSRIRCAAVTPDGRQLIVGCRDEVIRIHDWERGKDTALLKPAFKSHLASPVDVAVSSDGRRIAAAYENVRNHDQVNVWDSTTLQLIMGYHVDNSFAAAVSFDPTNPKRLTFPGQGSSLCLWDFAREKSSDIVTDLPSRVCSIRFTPDGSSIVVACLDGAIFVIRDAKAKLLHKFPDPPIWTWDIAISPDSKTLAVGTSDRDDAIFLFDLVTGKCLPRNQTHEPHK
jgi:WD40 repeat protein